MAACHRPIYRTVVCTNAGSYWIRARIFPYERSGNLGGYHKHSQARHEGSAMSDVPTYLPLDPNSEEGKLRKAYHELTQNFKVAEKANGTWHSLSEWMLDEHNRHVEGCPWQKVFEPRRINPPGGYHTPKAVAATISAFFSNVSIEQALGIPLLQTQVTAHAVLYEVIRSRVPIYYVADAFIRAVAATELPRDFTLYDLHWPMPGLVLGFPVQFMRGYLGRDVCYVYAADLKTGDHEPAS